MTVVTNLETDAKRAISDGQAFLDSLPVYRLAMHFAAVNMADLNFPGSPRSQAMDWWVSDDEGISQVGQIAAFIARFHEELLHLPGNDEPARSIGGMSVLTDKEGQHFTVSDLASKEDVLGYLHVSAGIWGEADGGYLLSVTPADRQARAMSATMMKDACDRVCVHIRQRFAPQDQVPRQAAGFRPPAGRTLTPSL